MVIVAQLVRASVCGTEGRGFKPRRSPHFLFRPGIDGSHDDTLGLPRLRRARSAAFCHRRSIRPARDYRDGQGAGAEDHRRGR